MTKLNLLLIGLTSLVFLSNCGDDTGGVVTDNFSATVSISGPQAVPEDAGSISFTIGLSETNTSGSRIVIPFILSGTAEANLDYDINESSVVIETNETSSTVNLSIINDDEVEDDETIIITLGSLSGVLSAGINTVATTTITDNDEDDGGGGSTDISINYGASTGSTIEVSDWTNTGADNYIILMNTENSFSDFNSNSNDLASTTYVGYGEQVVYNGSSINSFTVSLLQYSSEYFFKVIPVDGGSYDNGQTASSQNTDVCITTSTTENQVCFEISSDLRIISSNQYPNHATGEFPNYEGDNGEEFLPEEVARELDLTPTYTDQAIYVYDETGPPTPSNENFWQFGMAVNGIEFHPMGLKPWENPFTGEQNWEWQAKVTEEGETHLDGFGAHVTSKGNYHYHGDIVGLADEDGSRHSLIYGFAADGFPIYYKYGYAVPNDPTSEIVELESSYQLKSGARSGTGVAGEDYPDGTHDGTYIQDFEYVESLGDLDECNGRTGVTPEYPEGTYYYVITSEFPVVPNCFFGTPAEDWKIGQ